MPEAVDLSPAAIERRLEELRALYRLTVALREAIPVRATSAETTPGVDKAPNRRPEDEF